MQSSRHQRRRWATLTRGGRAALFAFLAALGVSSVEAAHRVSTASPAGRAASPIAKKRPMLLPDGVRVRPLLAVPALPLELPPVGSSALRLGDEEDEEFTLAEFPQLDHEFPLPVAMFFQVDETTKSEDGTDPRSAAGKRFSDLMRRETTSSPWEEDPSSFGLADIVSDQELRGLAGIQTIMRKETKEDNSMGVEPLLSESAIAVESPLGAQDALQALAAGDMPLGVRLELLALLVPLVGIMGYSFCTAKHRQSMVTASTGALAAAEKCDVHLASSSNREMGQRRNLMKKWLQTWLVEEGSQGSKAAKTALRRHVQAMPVAVKMDLADLLKPPLAASPVRAQLRSQQLVRVQARVLGPLVASEQVSACPLSGKASVMYSTTVSRRSVHRGLNPVTVAFAQERTDFVVSLLDDERIRIAVAQKEVSLFDMVGGEQRTPRRLAQAPEAWRSFLRTHQTLAMPNAEDELLEFREIALLVGSKVTIIGELVMGTAGFRILPPSSGNNSAAMAGAAKAVATAPQLSMRPLSKSSLQAQKKDEQAAAPAAGADATSPSEWPGGQPTRVLISDDPALL